MKSREQGTVIIECLASALVLLPLIAGALYLSQRFFLVHELEFQASQSAFLALTQSKPATAAAFTCIEASNSGNSETSFARARCGRLSRTAKLRR